MDMVYYHRLAPERQVIVMSETAKSVKIHYIQTTNPDNQGIIGYVKPKWFHKTYCPLPYSAPAWEV
jgi:hypothetical protein